MSDETRSINQKRLLDQFDTIFDKNVVQYAYPLYNLNECMLVFKDGSEAHFCYNSLNDWMLESKGSFLRKNQIDEEAVNATMLEDESHE